MPKAGRGPFSSPAARERSADRRGEGLRAVTPYLYLLPALVVMATFTYMPLARGFELSFFSWNMVAPVRPFVGVGNYVELLSSPEFWGATVNTALYIAVILLLTFVAPLGVAVLLASIKGVAGRVYQSVIFSPTVISLATAAVIWLWILNPIDGVINVVLKQLGAAGPSWLQDSSTVLLAVAMVTAWKSFGYNLLLFVAGLLSIPKAPVDAALVDGASAWQLLWYVRLPLLSPTMLFVLVTTVVLAAQQVFIPIQILTRGGPSGASTNLVYSIYEYGFQFFRVGIASALAMIVFLLFLALTWAQIRLLEGRVNYDS
jgi:sn-glycerol 3-phosphate transport system permease protein